MQMLTCDCKLVQTYKKKSSVKLQLNCGSALKTWMTWIIISADQHCFCVFLIAGCFILVIFYPAHICAVVGLLSVVKTLILVGTSGNNLIERQRCLKFDFIS